MRAGVSVSCVWLAVQGVVFKGIIAAIDSPEISNILPMDAKNLAQNNPGHCKNVLSMVRLVYLQRQQQTTGSFQ